MRRLALLTALAAAGCLPVYTPTGVFACSDDQCPRGYACDEGVCCVPGGQPACPTLPSPGGRCHDGGVAFTLYEDSDGDGVGKTPLDQAGASFTRLACGVPTRGRWAKEAGDCADDDPLVRPGAPDGVDGTPGACDGFDNDCDGEFDEASPNRRRFYRNRDNDGFGDQTDPGLLSCGRPQGTIDNNRDCNDATPTRSPNAVELCNGIDDDCDGQVDEGPLLDALTPGDPALTFGCVTGSPGVCAVGRRVCVGGAATCQPLTQPSLEVCNRLDDDCDGQTDEHPECGGPENLFDQSQVVVRARQFQPTSVASFAFSCPATLDGGVPVPIDVARRTWRFGYDGGQQPAYVVSFESVDGGAWDLTGANIRLGLELAATWSSGLPSDGGLWGDSTFFRTPVVTLCGARDDEIVRFVTVPSGGLRLERTSYATSLPMAAGGEWLFGISSGFDVAKVKRVAVVFRPYPVGPATVELKLDAGFSKDAGP